MTNRLNKLPEFLRVPVTNDDPNAQPIEKVEVNSINLVAALIDKVQESGNYQNDWSDLDTYLPEFKLDDVLEGLNDRFTINDPKMLKGFMRSKGTKSDIDYVTKNLGLKLDIKEADDYYVAKSIILYLLYNYDNLFEDWFFETVTDEMILKYLTERVRYVKNIDPDDVDNVDPFLVVNFNTSGREILIAVGVENPTDEQVAAMDEAIEAYLTSEITDYDAVDCSIVVVISYDMDSEVFDPELILNTNETMREITKNRLLPHVRLRGFSLVLFMSDNYDTSARVDDSMFVAPNHSGWNDDFVLDLDDGTESTKANVEVVDEYPSQSSAEEGEGDIVITRLPTKYSYDDLSIGENVIDTSNSSSIVDYDAYIGADLELKSESQL